MNYLDKVDLSLQLNKREYKKILPDITIRLGELQRKARELNIPILVVFAGWSASGKGTLVNQFISPLDPRGFKVYNIAKATEDEKARPYFWRFWTKTPARGRMSIFIRGWYQRVWAERIEKLVSKKEWMRTYDEINSFEKQLMDDGALIIKFWLHIDKKEQKRRLRELESDPATSWRVTKDDWRQHKHYKKYLVAVEEMFDKTNNSYAPWTIIAATDEGYATINILETFKRQIENKIKSIEQPKKEIIVKSDLPKDAKKSILGKVDLSKSLNQKEYEEKLQKYEKTIREIQFELYEKRKPMLILYEGWDAAGKGGNIKRLTHNLDPRGYEVVPIAAPNDLEKSHQYLWRFWVNLPKAGHITVFDRTWYGRVMVERIEGFCAEKDWKRAYQEINDFEKQLTDFGAIIIKFWLQIGNAEQLKRFKERETIPYKKWKITDEDYRNREKWNLYKVAVDEMLLKTSTPHAPWTIVESNSKYYARIKALKTVIDTAQEHLS